MRYYFESEQFAVIHIHRRKFGTMFSETYNLIIYNEQPIVHWTNGLNFVPFICAIRFGILRNQ